MTRYVLGISCHYHDASATLLKDGKVVFAVDEERLSRKKHDAGFPILAIQACLAWEKISIEQIDHIGFYEKPFLKFERILEQHLDYFPKTFKTFHLALPSWLSEKIRIRHIIRKRLKYKGDIFFVDHHLSHAASAFLPSPFQEAAILTIDGVGEWTTTAIGIGRGNSLKLLKEIRFPHSLGLLYSTLTAYLGFSVNNSEYKVMGLSPYGLMDRSRNLWYPKLRRVIDIKPDGSYSLHLEYFIFQHSDRMPSPLLCELLGGPIRKESDPLEKRHEDIAAALQMITEDAVLSMLRYAHQLTGCKAVVLSGGVALNSVCNGKILAESGFKEVWIQPNAGDGGNSMGVALYAENIILSQPRTYTLTDAYLGPEYSTESMETFLKHSKIKYTRYDSDSELLQDTAQMLSENQVIGWFQGRMEWGPRALGARSILSNPCSHEMKTILNEKVKHREAFRPFAPVICADNAEEYFDCDIPVPLPADFMLMVYPIREKFQSKLPAVTHVDGSGRLQTIRREQNQLYYDLIQEFGKRTDIPILVNTSFNIRGEPIVCTPEDAYRCMMGTGIDCLILGPFRIRREDNAEDIWDSESLAQD